MSKLNNNEYTIREIFDNLYEKVNYIKTKWITLVLFSVLFGLIAFAFAWKRGPIYKATMIFVSENSSGSISGYAAIAAQFGIDIGGGGEGAFSGDNLIEVMKSKQLIISVLISPVIPNDSSKLFIHEFIRANNPKLFENKKQLSELDFKNFGSKPNRKRDSILIRCANQIIKQKISIEKRDKKLNFIALSFEDPNEKLAQQFVTALSNTAIHYYTEYKTNKAQKVLLQLNRQCDSLRGLLYGSLSSAAITNDLNINPLKQILRSEAQRKQVDVQVNTVMYSEVLKQFALAKLTLEKETPLIQVIEEPILPLPIISLGKYVTAAIAAIFGIIFAITYCLMKRKTY